MTDRPEAIGLHPDVAAGLEIARSAAADLGAEVVELAAPGDLPVGDLMTILLSDMWTEHADYADRTDRYRPSIAGLVAMSRDATEAQAYIRAQARRTRVTARWETWFARNRVDAVLEPTVPGVAGPRAGGYDASNLGGDGDPLIVLTATWDVTGFPVAALPAGVGHETGLPVGISLIAPRGAEAPLIQTAIDLQEHALPPIVPPR